jgi:hypothetical protein
VKNLLATVLIGQARLEQIRKKNKLNRLLCFGSEFLINSLCGPFFKAGMIHASESWQQLGFEDTVVNISFDSDLQKDYDALPSVLKVLQTHRIRASFATIGKWIEIYPDIHKQLLDEGHEIVNHTYTHPNNRHFNPGKKMIQLSDQEKKEEIYRCHEVCEKLLNYTLKGYRAPHLDSCHDRRIYPILRELGYTYSSSDMAFRFDSLGAPCSIEGIWEFPLSPASPLSSGVWHLYTCLSTSVVARERLFSEKEYLKNYTHIITAAKPGYFNFYFDPMDVVRMPTFSECLTYLSEMGVEAISYGDLVESLKKNMRIS